MRKNTPATLKDTFIESLAKSGAIELRLVARNERDNASVRSAHVNAPTRNAHVNTPVRSAHVNAPARSAHVNASARSAHVNASDKAPTTNADPNETETAERPMEDNSSTETTENSHNEDEFETLFLTEEYYDLDNRHGMTKKKTPLLVKKTPELVIKTLKSVDYRTEGLIRRPIISLQFNEDDSVAFEKISGANIGKQLAVVIDDEIKTAPVIKAAITGGRVEIRGISVARTAKILADVLRAGSLPYSLKVVEKREEG